MNDHDEVNPVIPEIPQPIFPEPRRIEIWPGVPTEKKPVPLEGPGREVQEVNDPPPSLAPQPQTGGSGKGGRGSNLPRHPPMPANSRNLPIPAKTLVQVGRGIHRLMMVSTKSRNFHLWMKFRIIGHFAIIKSLELLYQKKDWIFTPLK